MECIADMVINKISGVSSCIELALDEADSGNRDACLRKGLHGLNDLTNWIKYLQMVRDFALAAKVMDERDNDKRRERRYPVPEFYRQYINLIVDCGDGGAVCTLVNFSQQGMCFISRDAIIEGTICRCGFSVAHAVSEELSFPVRVRYCVSRDDVYEVGAEVASGEDEISFNLFRSVTDAMQTMLPSQRPD
ncbi:MAG: PilZ domain-containing protein [Nitrospirae bacterium]|nr:PilZ domain-containing protein [Nitrospirota bacterium]